MDRLPPINLPTTGNDIHCAVTNALWIVATRFVSSLSDDRKIELLVIVRTYRVEREFEIGPAVALDVPKEVVRDHLKSVRDTSSQLLSLLNANIDEVRNRMLPVLGESYAFRSKFPNLEVLREELENLIDAAEYQETRGLEPRKLDAKQSFIFGILDLLTENGGQKNTVLMDCLRSMSKELKRLWDLDNSNTRNGFALGGRKNLERHLIEWRNQSRLLG